MEARYARSWNKANRGINPLNGSDSLNNPDGMDMHADEQLVNWLEYHLKDKLFSMTKQNLDYHSQKTSPRTYPIRHGPD